MNIGHYIKSRRENIGISQAELARRLEINRSVVSRWENDIAEPGFNNFLSICKVLGMNPNDFIEEMRDNNERD